MTTAKYPSVLRVVIGAEAPLCAAVERLLSSELDMVCVATVTDADTFAAAAVACYDQGDAREQESWLKALALLPAPERFLPQAIDACRTNIVPLFEAIAPAVCRRSWADTGDRERRDAAHLTHSGRLDDLQHSAGRAIGRAARTDAPSRAPGRARR